MSKGRPVALMGLLQDITEQYRMEQKLRQTARTDDLTQLSNRAEFNRVLDSRLREADARNTEFCGAVDRSRWLQGRERRFGARRRRRSAAPRGGPAPCRVPEFVCSHGSEATSSPFWSRRRWVESPLRPWCKGCFTASASWRMGLGKLRASRGRSGSPGLVGKARSRTELLRNADTALYEPSARARVPPAPIRGHQIATPAG